MKPDNIKLSKALEGNATITMLGAKARILAQKLRERNISALAEKMEEYSYHLKDMNREHIKWFLTEFLEELSRYIPDKILLKQIQESEEYLTFKKSTANNNSTIAQEIEYFSTLRDNTEQQQFVEPLTKTHSLNLDAFMEQIAHSLEKTFKNEQAAKRINNLRSKGVVADARIVSEYKQKTEQLSAADQDVRYIVEWYARMIKELAYSLKDKTLAIRLRENDAIRNIAALPSLILYIQEVYKKIKQEIETWKTLIEFQENNKKHAKEIMKRFGAREIAEDIMKMSELNDDREKVLSHLLTILDKIHSSEYTYNIQNHAKKEALHILDEYLQKLRRREEHIRKVLISILTQEQEKKQKTVKELAEHIQQLLSSYSKNIVAHYDTLLAGLDQGENMFIDSRRAFVNYTIIEENQALQMQKALELQAEIRKLTAEIGMIDSKAMHIAEQSALDKKDLEKIKAVKDSQIVDLILTKDEQGRFLTDEEKSNLISIRQQIIELVDKIDYKISNYRESSKKKEEKIENLVKETISLSESLAKKRDPLKNLLDSLQEENEERAGEAA